MLLCDSDNPYERALAEAGREAARARAVELLAPQFAAISSVTQLSTLFTFQRSGVDGYVFLAVDPDLLTSAIEVAAFRASVA
jgi:ABC-type sugar transport system substrate-binding protein